MKEKFSARRLCRAGVIAALYVALSYLVQPFAFGAVQMRLSEALTVLPLFFIESVPALFKKNYDVVVLKDYSGNDRMVLATKRK